MAGPDFTFQYRIERSSPIIPAWHEWLTYEVGTTLEGARRDLEKERQVEVKMYPHSPARFRLVRRPMKCWEVIEGA